MNTTDITQTETFKMSQADKDYMIETFRSCPDWCLSVTHLEAGPYFDGSIRHIADIGKSHNFHVNVVRKTLQGVTEVYVEINADLFHGSADLGPAALAEFAMEFPALLAKAQEMVERIS